MQNFMEIVPGKPLRRRRACKMDGKIQR